MTIHQQSHTFNQLARHPTNLNAFLPQVPQCTCREVRQVCQTAAAIQVEEGELVCFAKPVTMFVVG